MWSDDLTQKYAYKEYCMKMIFVSKCLLENEQYCELKISILISHSKSLISSRWVTNTKMQVKSSVYSVVIVTL